MRRKHILSFFLFVSLLLNTCLAAAPNSNGRPTINILTWWGYLNGSDIVKLAEKECGVTISFDEYYSNDEFLRRWESQRENYDVLIFSGTIYNVVQDRLPHYKSSTLWRQSLGYNKIIRQHYNKAHYPHNVVYFLHSLTGFLWNPKNILLTDQDSVASIFKKARNNYVVLIDDPVEANQLIREGLPKQNSNDHMSILTFKSAMQSANVYITNNYNQIYKKPEFAFSFSWSGEAMVDLMESNKNYQFLVHPKLSYISSDLLAQNSDRKSAFCVSKYLTSRATTINLQNNEFYFPPFLDYSSVKNKTYLGIYKNFMSKLSKMSWIDSENEVDFQKLNDSWQLIKLSLNTHAS